MNVPVLDHFPELVRAARLRGLSREDAEEVVQDAFLVCERKAATREIEYLGGGSIRNRAGRLRPVRAWLHDVVGLLLRNRMRSHRRHEARWDPLERAAEMPADALSPAEELELLDFGTAVFALVKGRDAEILRLDLLGYRSHEIAAELGIPAATVRVRKMRALAQLRREPSLQRFAARDAAPEEPDDRRDGPDDPPPPSSGSGGSEGGSMSRHGKSANPDPVTSRSRIEGLLEAYGQLCRRRGLDPAAPRGKAVAPPPSSSVRIGTFRLGFGVAAFAVLVWLVATTDAPLPGLDARSGPSSGSGRAEVVGIVQPNAAELPAQVAVAVLPDLPPSIQIVRTASHPVRFRSSSGGGLLLTDPGVSADL